MSPGKLVCDRQPFFFRLTPCDLSGFLRRPTSSEGVGTSRVQSPVRGSGYQGKCRSPLCILLARRGRKQKDVRMDAGRHCLAGSTLCDRPGYGVRIGTWHFPGEAIPGCMIRAACRATGACAGIRDRPFLLRGGQVADTYICVRRSVSSVSAGIHKSSGLR